MSTDTRRPDVDKIVRPSHGRYRDIAKEKSRKDLKKYMRDSSFVGQQGDRHVRVPMPVVNLPHITFGPNNSGKGYGIGHGIGGKPGDILRPGTYPGAGGGAGTDEAVHGLQEFELSREELAKILGEELSLPNMTKRHSGELEVVGHKYSGRTTVGPDVMLITKDTLLNALIRGIAEDTYDEEDPLILPVRDDFRYRTIRPIMKPTSKAVIFFLRDVSGSMGMDDRMELSFASSYWLQLWIEYCYGGRAESVYILHDHRAWEASQNEFLTSDSGGGTLMSSALALTREIINIRYPVNEWNIYIFQYGDGDVFGRDDFKGCLTHLTEIYEDIALYGYTQVAEQHDGDFLSMMRTWLARPAVEEQGLRNIIKTTLLTNYADMPKAIKEVLS